MKNFVDYSLGGTIATLAVLHYLFISSSRSACAPAPPVLCVTFGSPLLGNEALSVQGLCRWVGNFCHVISQHDIILRLLFCPMHTDTVVPAHFMVGTQLRQWPEGAVAMKQKLDVSETPAGSPYRPFGTYASKRAGQLVSLNCAHLATRLGRITPCRAEVEWYRTLFDNDVGYYDAFKQRRSSKMFSRANMLQKDHV